MQIDARSEAEQSELSGRVREERVETQKVLVASQNYATNGSGRDKGLGSEISPMRIGDIRPTTPSYPGR